MRFIGACLASLAIAAIAVSGSGATITTSTLVPVADAPLIQDRPATNLNVFGLPGALKPATLNARAKPSNTSLPTISGTAQVGSTLTADPGSWSGTAPISYAYQWRRCNSAGTGCVDIVPAAAQTYTLSSADVGSTIRVVVTASNSAGSASAVSAPTAVVTAVVQTPTNSAPPVVSDTSGHNPPQVADVLSTTNGSWTNSPTGYAYQWQLCDSSGTNCTPMAGATQSRYTPVSGDVGHALRAQVTASNSAGSAVRNDSTV